MANLDEKTTLAIIGGVLGIHPDRLWGIRKGHEAFDIVVCQKVPKAKPIFDGSRIPKKISRQRKVVVEPDKNDKSIQSRLGGSLPKIDKENLQQEIRLACLVIASLTLHDLHEISLAEIRRWGALLAMSHDEILHKASKNVDFEREVRLLREQMHRILTARSSRPHSSNSGVADVA